MKNDWRKLLNQMFFVDDVRNSLGIIYIYLFPFSVRWTYLCTFESDHHNRKPFKTAPPTHPTNYQQPPLPPIKSPNCLFVEVAIEVHRSCTHYLSLLVDIFKYFEVSIRRYFHLLFLVFFSPCLFLEAFHIIVQRHIIQDMKKCPFCQNIYEKRSRFLFRDFLIWSKTFQTFSCIYRP